MARDHLHDSADRGRGHDCRVGNSASAGSDPSWTIVATFSSANTFIATRPMTTAGLVAAKFRMAAASVLVSWVLAVAGTIVLACRLRQPRQCRGTRARNSSAVTPVAEASRSSSLSCILLPALSWRFLTGTLAPVLTGRRWVADGAVWLFLARSGGLRRLQFLVGTDRLRRRSIDCFPRFPGWSWSGHGQGSCRHCGISAPLCGWGCCRGAILSVSLALWLVLTGCGIAMAAPARSDPGHCRIVVRCGPGDCRARPAGAFSAGDAGTRLESASLGERGWRPGRIPVFREKRSGQFRSHGKASVGVHARNASS